jgi:amino acid adenylation domain-containing protein
MEDKEECKTLIDLLDLRANYQAESWAFSFLNDGESDENRWNYQTLMQRSQSIAAHLSQIAKPGERALMFFPSGLDFIAAFFGCLMAGVIAVPAYPPRKNRNLARLQAIIDDADPQLIMTTASIMKSLLPMFAESDALKTLPWVAVDTLNEETFSVQDRPPLTADTLAFLQYTSGSTGLPKGVMISHGNLLHNSRITAAASRFGQHPDDIGVGWLPLFHDMGLIGLMLQPLYAGYPCVLMSPASFLQKPWRWLSAMSRFRATASVVPNFAFDLCVNETTAAQRAELDLSALNFILCGAEPVRYETLTRFVKAFSPTGLRPEVIYPAYGLAEATLMVTGGDLGAEVNVKAVDAESLKNHRMTVVEPHDHHSQWLIGNGYAWLEQTVLIVHPEEKTVCADGLVGEIWVSGGSVAQGYWKRYEQTRDTFQAHLANTGQGPFLRTGDLGCFLEGQLYVTGRIKDLVIISGRNHYPQDLEWTVSEAFSQRDLPVLGQDSAVAFSVLADSAEQLVIVAEISRQYFREIRRQVRCVSKGKPVSQDLLQFSDIGLMIRKAVSEWHELTVYDVVLLKPGDLPKTSSGKVQRYRAREVYQSQSFSSLWQQKGAKTTPSITRQKEEEALESTRPNQSVVAAISREKSVAVIQSWLQNTLAKRLKITLEELDVGENLAIYGLNSMIAMQVTGDLESWLGRKVLPQTLWEYPSVVEISQYLSIKPDTDWPLPASIPQIVPNREDKYRPFPLNPIQEAYWFGRSEAFELSQVACHFYLEFDSDIIDIAKLNKSWCQLVARHDMLRAVIGGDGQQRILEQLPDYQIPVIDLYGWKAQQAAAYLGRVRHEMSHQVLPADHWPLFDLRAHIMDAHTMRLNLSFDMLIADVWSFFILFREWQQLYEQPDVQLPPLNLSFRDYVLMEQNIRESADYQRSLAYWSERINDLPLAPELPLAKNPASIGKPQFVRRTSMLNCDTWDRLKKRAAMAGLTPSSVLCTAYADVLATWSKTSRFSLNLTLFNRLPVHPEVNQLVGDFTSVLLLAVNTASGDHFQARAEQLQSQLWTDLEHRQVNGVDVLRLMSRQQQEGHPVTMPVVFTSALGIKEMQGIQSTERCWLGERVFSVSQTPQVWLDHQVMEEEGALGFSWDVVEELFPDGVIQDMFDAYCQWITVLSNNDQAWLDTTGNLTPEWQLSLWESVNDTATKVPTGLLHEPFFQQVEYRATQPAILSPRKDLSYQQLANYTYAIAAQLREWGAKPNQLVAVVMEKGWEQVAAVLGILQSGAAYLPIDASLPNERIALLLEQGEVRVVLSQSWVHWHTSGLGEWHIMMVDELSPDVWQRAPIRSIQKPEDLAYVIFTSGSTGLPKGVMIDHRGALNTVLDINSRFLIGPKDRALGLSSLSFDLSVYDIFGILGAGGSLVLPDAEQLKDPGHWTELMVHTNITVWNSAPALMKMFLEYTGEKAHDLGMMLRLVMMSGDWIPLTVPGQLKKLIDTVQVVSLGGATEASIWSIIYPVLKVDPLWRSIPYGKPLLNQQMFVLDENLEPCPAWVVNDLYIGGVGLAKGYWRDREKTAASFVYHPRTGERLYKTGDIGRYLNDGNIEFLGRSDFQVKIQGYRIELGEIESVLSEHPAIKDCVVTVWENPETGGEKQLVVYVVSLLDIDRVAVDIPCSIEYAPGEMIPLRLLDLSCQGSRLSGVPADWTEGQKLVVSLILPGTSAEQAFHAVLIWREEEVGGIRFDSHADTSAIDQALAYLTRENKQFSVVDARRFSHRDAQRNSFRAPLNQSCQIDDGKIKEQATALNISLTGMELADLADEWQVGDELTIYLNQPNADLTLFAQVSWRSASRAGVKFAETDRNNKPLGQLIDNLIKTEGHWFSRFSVGGIRQFLSSRLPTYMVPQWFMLVDSLPLSSNGKIDRKALPVPMRPESATVSPAVSKLEKQLVGLWCEVLGVDDLGIHDNFFELGGYSQLAVKLLLRMREDLQIDLPIRALFETPSIAGLATRISRESGIPHALEESEDQPENWYGQYARLGIARRIQVIGADKSYTHAQGQTLRWESGDQSGEVLDMVGGYGSTILGHNHPELETLAIKQLQNALPMHAQHSNNVEAGALGKALSDRIGNYTGRRYVATLASTGAEAVEAAIKHAKMTVHQKARQEQKNDRNLASLLSDQVYRGRARPAADLFVRATKLWGDDCNTLDTLQQKVESVNQVVYQQEPLFIALKHAFHGMTSGALSLTASTDFREPFQWMGLRSCWVEHNAAAVESLIASEKQHTWGFQVDEDGEITLATRPWITIGGLFLEPIQGEGGIHLLNKTLVAELRHFADQYGFPLIIDEIQCGMGRSGTFCAAEQLDLRGDYYTFSKSLGGGLSKVSALMVDAALYLPDFGYYHGSTFAEDKPACALALKTLEIIDRDDVSNRCRLVGERFMAKLRILKQRYPDVVAEIRGLGLMIGLEIKDQSQSSSFLLRALSQDNLEILSHLIAGYLLNRQSIRLAPTKTRNTLRFLPSVYFSDQEMDHVVAALDRVCQMIHYANPGRLLRYMTNVPQNDLEPIIDFRQKHPPVQQTSPPEGVVRVAHIGHVEDNASLLLAEPSLVEVPSDQREDLLLRMFPVSKVAVVQQALITTPGGEQVHLSTIGLALTGALFETMMQTEESRTLLLDKIDEAVELAKQQGCEVIGFGGYTSIVTLNCTAVATTGVTLTSGNAYTTALGVEGGRQMSHQQGVDLAQSRIGIVGAKGNIGSICARILTEDSPHLTLFGRHENDEELTKLANSLSIELGAEADVRISTDLSDLSECALILSATNASLPIIFPEHLSTTNRVICDIATPPDVSPRVLQECPHIQVISAGLAQLPGSPGLQLLGTRLPLDHVYGCVAETTLLGLAHYQGHFSFGEMDKDQIEFVRALAKKYQYRMSTLKADKTS